MTEVTQAVFADHLQVERMSARQVELAVGPRAPYIVGNQVSI
jgi:hypothetical protein